jgi:hypothetical protein
MTNHGQKYFWLTAVALLVIQATLAMTMVHRESLTFDEGDHMFRRLYDVESVRLWAKP